MKSKWQEIGRFSVIQSIGIARTAAILLIVAAATAAQASDVDKTLTLDAVGLTSMRIQAGAGFLHVQGVEGNQIEVVGRILGDPRDYRFTLEKRGDAAVLVSESKGWNLFMLFGQSNRIDVTVKVPTRLAIDIDDGSGELKVSRMNASVRIEDGSGDLEVDDIKGDVEIRDGSGAILVNNINGGVTIHDGSGAIRVTNINGHVGIHDGSGGIYVANVKKGLRIYDSGSGGLTTANIEGELQTDR